MFGNVIVDAAFGLAWSLLFQASYSIGSESMLPNYHPGEIVIGSRYPYGFGPYSYRWFTLPIESRLFGGEPQRGDVAAFRVPGKQDVYLKRVIGLPGDRVQMIHGVLHINGQPVVLDTVGPYQGKLKSGLDATVQRETLPNGVSYEVLDMVNDPMTDDTPEFVVPERNYFVLGDNRDNSFDSRFDMGFIPYSNLISRIWP